LRAGFTRDMADQLLDDLERAVDWFQHLPSPMPEPVLSECPFCH